jgi:hypothetical protein
MSVIDEHIKSNSKNSSLLLLVLAATYVRIIYHACASSATRAILQVYCA